MGNDSRIVYAPRENKKISRFSRTRLFIYAGILIFIFMAGGAVYAMRLSQWQIKEISLSGLGVLGEEEIVAVIKESFSGNLAFLIPRSSFFIVSTQRLVSALEEKFPRIRQVSITKSFPNLLRVSVKERKPFGIFCAVLRCAYVDDSSFAYEEAPNSIGSLIIKITSDAEDLKIPAQAVDNLLFERMKLVAEGLKDKFDFDTIGYQLFSKIPREIRVTTSEGFQIYINRDDDFESVFRVLKKVLDEEIKEKRLQLEYIDARFGNKVFYKFKQ